MYKKYLAMSVITFTSLNISAQSNFNQLVVFGDSLLDTGNYGAAIKFTNQTSPGVYAPVAPEFLSDYLQLELTPAIDGGGNYAVGGYQTADILNSISGSGIDTTAAPTGATAPAYLTSVNGTVGANTLVLMDGGGNDIRAIVTGNIFTPENIPDEVLVAAQTYIQSIRELADAGAKYIMVANTPDLGVTPGVQYFDKVLFPGFGAAQGFTDTAAGYNDAVTTLANLYLADVNIVPVDIAGFVDYMYANADTFGFASGDLNVSGTVLDQFSMCYDGTDGDCVEHPTYGISGTDPNPRNLFFNDILHPAEYASELFGDYLVDIIAAPLKVGLLPELALSAARTQASLTANELMHSRWGGTEGRLFVSADAGNDEYETALSSKTDTTNLTVGRTFVASDTLIYGAAVSLSDQKLDIEGADFEADSWGLSGMLGYRKNGVFVDTLLGLSVLSYDGLRRDVKLGSQTLTAKGDTDGHAWTVDALAGIDMLSSDTWHLAPAAGVRYINTTVDSYTEAGGEISNYNWGEQRRKSLQWRYGVVGSGDLSKNLKVFAEVLGSQEQEDDSERITIRNTNLSFPAYKLPSFEVDDDAFVTAVVGGSLSIPHGASLNMTYNYSSQGDGYEHVILSYSTSM